MEVNFPIEDISRLGQAFVFAARAYTKYRFYPERSLTYFLDAVKYYYELNKRGLTTVSIIGNLVISLENVPSYVNIKLRIPFQSLRKKLIVIRGTDQRYPVIPQMFTRQQLFGRDDVDYIIPQRPDIETMILAIGTNLPGPLFPMLPLARFKAFPPSEDTLRFNPEVTFADPSFHLSVPKDLTIINRVGYDPEFLRDNLLNEEMTSIVLTTKLNCRDTIIRYLFNELPPEVLRYCAYYLRLINTGDVSTPWLDFFYRKIGVDHLMLALEKPGNYFNLHTMHRILGLGNTVIINQLLPRFNANINNSGEVVDQYQQIGISPSKVFMNLVENRKKFNVQFLTESLEDFFEDDFIVQFPEETTQYQNDYPMILPNEPIEEADLDVDISTMILLGEGSYGRVYGTPDSEFVYKAFRHPKYFTGELASINYLSRYLTQFNNIARVICYDSKRLLFKCMRLLPLPVQTNPFIGDQSIFFQLAQGLNSLHSSGLIHVDIKPANIMMTAESRIEFIDFGLVRTTCKRPQQIPAGTYVYSPPEYFAGALQYWRLYGENPQKVMQSHDVWSMIISVYELALGMHYYDFLRTIGYIQNIDELFTTFLVLASQENPFQLAVYPSKNSIVKTRVATSDVASITPPEFVMLHNFTQDERIQEIIVKCLRHNPLERASALDILSLLNYIPETINPCLRADLIDSGPFPHSRLAVERENWIALCRFFNVDTLRYIRHFESITSNLTYIDYFSILQACRRLDQIPQPLIYSYVDLPHPVPLYVYSNNSNPVTEYDSERLVRSYQKKLANIPFWTPPEKIFPSVDENFYFMLESAFIRGDFETKCATQVLNLS